jgi:hypothetical protein
LENASAIAASPALQEDGFAHYRGELPLIAPSVNRIDLNLAEQTDLEFVGTNAPPVRDGPTFASVSVTYRPRFTFQKTL